MMEHGIEEIKSHYAKGSDSRKDLLKAIRLEASRRDIRSYLQKVNPLQL